jgi:hypothetical protein
MEPRLRFALSAVLAPIVFGVGYYVAILIPGAGNTPDKDFADFYNSDGKIAMALVLFFVLVAGCLIMLWFFNELRARLPEGMLTRIGYSAAVVGVVAVPAGAAIMLGPAGAHTQVRTRRTQTSSASPSPSHLLKRVSSLCSAWE